MKYTSQNGCFYYYDSILYRWQIAEPTLLFILGLESVLSSDKSQSDKITISKYIYQTYSDTVAPLNYIHEIFDDIYSFLSKIGSVEDFEHYIKFNCYGLKLTLNDLTGESEDRTVPIIFKNDANKLIVSDLIADMSPTRDSYYDCQAKVIIDTFSNAGYELTLDNKGKPNFLIDKSGSNIKDELSALLNYENQATAKVSQALRKKLLRNITTYNDDLKTKHKERLQTESIYNLIDYKAMYAYSLGVLYGCRCLGFADTVIWRLDPKFWYNGEYSNLVRTAWYTFKFHWTLKDEEPSEDNLIPTLLSNRQLIQDNKIWNFNNTEDIVNPPLAQDEHQCFCLYVNSTTHEKVSESLLYSLETKIDENEQRGSFLRKYISLTNGHVIWKWLPINVKVSDDTPMKGVISSRDTPLIRYIGNDQVTIYRAYKYSKNEYLAPKQDGVYKKYFVYTGDLGWVDFKENSFCDNNSDAVNVLIGDGRKNFLKLVPEKPLKSDLTHAFPRNPSTEIPGAVTCYKCYVTKSGDDENSDILYGIYNKYINTDHPLSIVPSNFDYIMSAALYKSKFSNTESDDFGKDGIEAFYYDLNKEIKLLLKKITYNGKTFYVMYDDVKTESGSSENSEQNLENAGQDSEDIEQQADTLLYTPEYFGYSERPSSLLTLYCVNNDNRKSSIPLEKIFRYISNGSESLHWDEQYTGRTWITANNNDSIRFNGLYRLTDKVINMYRGEVKISDLTNMSIYNNYAESIGNPPSTLTKYIYCNENLLYEDVEEDQYNFIAVGNYENQDTLYRLGITERLCPFIKEDDDKNSLLDDDDTPLVWYDPKYKVYWNGLYGINRWQKTKPSRNSLSMFDAITGTLLPVFIEGDGQLISIDGDTAITYETFYSNSNYGIVRTKLKVFNPVASNEIKECYCDTKSDPNDYSSAIYCIPGITTDGWKSRSEITELGWWFVDGTTTLYSGEESNEFVTDNDHND